MKRLGIVGGLGPETGCMFFLNINNHVIKERNIQPDIIMENVPMPESVLKELAHGKKPAEVLALLSRSVTRLNIIGSEIIAIPCNTVHTFIDQLRFISKIPILSIIEEAAKECKRKGVKNIGIVGSTTSIKENLHSIELSKRNINCIIPTIEQQEKISEIIVKTVMNQVKKNDKIELITILKDIKNRGADSILLACTDLRTIISSSDIDIPIFETTSILEKAAAQAIMK
jgi:aspartate racemase